MQNKSSNPPDKSSGNGGGGAPGGSTSANVSRSGATELSSSAVLDNQTYSSSTGGQNALLVTDGEITLTTPTINKTGDESSEDSDFYGTNAAVLVTGGTLTLDGGTVNTNGAHANGIFSYGDGKIVVKNTTISTSNNNSGGIMVTGGGSLTATNLTVETAGNSSATIRSDRGGGTMQISGGSYKSTGVGSPAIYSTADIDVSDANLVSTASEGVVIEGSNSVTIENTNLTDTNTSLNGNSETYKNIFIYQSMSGDAEEGTGSFTARNSKIITNQGDTFFITNTTAKITLSGNQITNNDSSSAFLRAQAGKWGTSGKNGGHIDLTLTGQVAEGDIVLDFVSTLNLVLSSESFYMGAINSANSASSVSVSLDETSNLILAGDTYLTSLTNADSSNQNIYSNGYTLYVSGTTVSVNDGEIPEIPASTLEETHETETDNQESNCVSDSSFSCETAEEENGTTSPIPFIVGGVALAVIVASVVTLIIHKKRHKSPKNPTPTEGVSTETLPQDSLEHQEIPKNN